MKKMYEMSKYIDDVTNAIIRNVIEAQKETAQKTWEDVVEKAPYRDGTYASSIEVGDTKKEGNKITTQIFTEEQVTTKDGKSYNLGFLLENGTDEHAIPNAFGFGYTRGHFGSDGKYHKGTLDPDWHPGTIAQPHFKPALNDNEYAYLENIRKAVKEAKNG